MALWMAVKDSKGQPAERIRFLVQLGKQEVVYNKTAIPEGGNVTTRAVKVAMIVQQQHFKPQHHHSFL